jgi:nanoRNase/pAp phosphatase (c-di-AMP/oligoRNAs hydrolase)
MNITVQAKDLVETLKRFSSILIFIKGSPDPDAIASSYGLHVICEMLAIRADIISPLNVSLPQNKAFTAKLNIPVIFSPARIDFSQYDSYAVLDHQSNLVQGIDLPCAVHIDHHEKLPKNEPAAYSFISEEVTSVSTFLALILKELQPVISAEQMSAVSTALSYGILTDTNNLQLSVGYDREALEFLSIYSNRQLLDSFMETPYSEETLTVITKAMMNNVVYKNWMFAGVGFIGQNYRDAIALTADFMLEHEDVSTIIVYAIIRRPTGGMYLDVSIRSKNKRLNINSLVKSITPNGGGRQYKGAYQIDLDYFTAYPEQREIWNIVSRTTIEQMKTARDNVSFIPIAEVGASIAERLRTLFGFGKK